MSYLIQGLLSFACAFYQVCAIYFYKNLLRYRLYVSRFNKLVILYILYLLIWTHVYRLSQEGKLCAGDDLTHSEKQDPSIRSQYMIQIGNILKGYMIGTWVLVGMSILACIVFSFLLFKAFS